MRNIFKPSHDLLNYQFATFAACTIFKNERKRRGSFNSFGDEQAENGFSPLKFTNIPHVEDTTKARFSSLLWPHTSLFVLIISFFFGSPRRIEFREIIIDYQYHLSVIPIILKFSTTSYLQKQCRSYFRY